MTVPLQQAGLDVVGVDVDEQMLSAAAAKGARKLVRADMRRFCFAARFQLVLVAYNSLQLLSGDRERLACLRAARAHLRVAGRFATELTDFQDGDEAPWVEPERLASADGVTLWGSLHHDVRRRITRYGRRYEEGGEAYDDAVELRSLTDGEVRSLFRRAGFTDVTVRRRGRASRWVACAP